MEKLTARQSQFVKEYVVDFNATAACIRAGYSKKGATVQGSRLLAIDKVKAAVEEATAAVAEKTQLDAAWIVNELEQNHKLARDRGELAQSNRALELIGKQLGMFTDKSQVDTNIDLRVITGIDAGVGSKVEVPNG